jgi:sigma-B regulation protein RsbU (phosphoserine phosphatase)
MVEETHSNRLLERRFRAKSSELCQTREAVRACLSTCGCRADSVEEVVLAVDEACQNIIRHAYCGDTDGEIVLELDMEGDALVVSLLDFAPSVSPDCMKPRDLDDVKPGGLGTHFMRTVMDEVSLGRAPSGQGNILKMVKRIT